MHLADNVRLLVVSLAAANIVLWLRLFTKLPRGTKRLVWLPITLSVHRLLFYGVVVWFGAVCDKACLNTWSSAIIAHGLIAWGAIGIRLWLEVRNA